MPSEATLKELSKKNLAPEGYRFVKINDLIVGNVLYGIGWNGRWLKGIIEKDKFSKRFCIRFEGEFGGYKPISPPYLNAPAWHYHTPWSDLYVKL